MKFLKLEILNLASLDRPDGETIDFEHGALADSTIFSIVGPTGSGKSTLLDAICLALYNRAPRYPRRKGDRNQNIEIFGSPEDGENNRLAPTDSRNILTRGRKRGYSKLTFLANNGCVYRAEWHVRFQRVRYENAHTLLFKITDKDGKITEEAADWNSLNDIIGLDYEQFLRTVLIAQGSFANFLNAKENERYELLEKLIGGEETYSRISIKIDEHRRIAADRLKDIKAQLAAYEQDDLTDEQLAELNSKIAALEEQARQNKKELDAVKTALEWYAREDKYSIDLKELATKLDSAKLEIKSCDDMASRLTLHDATLTAVTIYKDAKETKQAIGKIDNEIKHAEESMKVLKSDIENETATLDKLKATAKASHEELEKQKPHINRARSIKAELTATLKAVAEKKQNVANANDSAKLAKQAIEKNTEDIAKAEKEFTELSKTYASLKTETEEQCQKLTQSATEARNAYDTERTKGDGIDAEALQNAKTTADNALADIKEAVSTLRELGEKKAERKKKSHEQEELKQRLADTTAELGKLNIDETKSELDTLRHTHTLMTSSDWQTHRLGLHEGKPCPLCGATHHPYAEKDAIEPVITEMAMLIKKKETLLNEMTARKTKLTEESGKMNGSISQIDVSIKSLDNDITNITNKWNAIHDKHSDWPTDIAALNDSLPEFDRQAHDATTALKAYNMLCQNIEKLRKAKDKTEGMLAEYKELADKKLKQAEQQKTAAETTLATVKDRTANLQASLKEKNEALATATKAANEAEAAATKLKEDMKAEIGDKEPDSYEDMLTKATKDADDNAGKKSEYIAQLNSKLGTLNGRLSAAQKQRQAAAETLADKNRELTEWIDNFNSKNVEAMVTIDDIALLYSSTDNWEQIRHDIQTKKDALIKIQTLFDNETRQHNGHQANKPQDTRENLTAKKKELESRPDTELIEAKSRKQRYDRARQQMGIMHDTKQQAEQEANEWTAITDAIGTDGRTLRKIAQCYTLSFLIAHANAEIRKFNSRYELVQVRHSLGIRVIDHDRADDIRDTTSLSGGETFIVSLGLALGLSALSSRNISFDNLFIDEGFGTLDPDTLATVIDSLAMLQSSQGKKVGVISHTDTMSERITTQIRIIKNGNSGSSHIEIYP